MPKNLMHAPPQRFHQTIFLSNRFRIVYPIGIIMDAITVNSLFTLPPPSVLFIPFSFTVNLFGVLPVFLEVSFNGILTHAIWENLCFTQILVAWLWLYPFSLLPNSLPPSTLSYPCNFFYHFSPEHDLYLNDGTVSICSLLQTFRCCFYEYRLIE